MQPAASKAMAILLAAGMAVEPAIAHFMPAEHPSRPKTSAPLPITQALAARHHYVNPAALFHRYTSTDRRALGQTVAAMSLGLFAKPGAGLFSEDRDPGIHRLLALTDEAFEYLPRHATETFWALLDSAIHYLERHAMDPLIVGTEGLAVFTVWILTRNVRKKFSLSTPRPPAPSFIQWVALGILFHVLFQLLLSTPVSSQGLARGGLPFVLWPAYRQRQAMKDRIVRLQESIERLRARLEPANLWKDDAKQRRKHVADLYKKIKALSPNSIRGRAEELHDAISEQSAFFKGLETSLPPLTVTPRQRIPRIRTALRHRESPAPLKTIQRALRARRRELSRHLAEIPQSLLHSDLVPAARRTRRSLLAIEVAIKASEESSIDSLVERLDSAEQEVDQILLIQRGTPSKVSEPTLIKRKVSPLAKPADETGDSDKGIDVPDGGLTLALMLSIWSLWPPAALLALLTVAIARQVPRRDLRLFNPTRLAA